MHRPIFGHSFAVLVAPILLSVLVFRFLNKKKAGVRRNEEDADTGAPGSMTVPTEANSDGSSSLPTETNSGGSTSSPTETNNGGSSSPPMATNSGGFSSSPTEAKSGGSTSSPTEIFNGASSSSPTETNNSASSSLTVTTGNRYEVFLSFRGPDTRYGFTGHLYKGLLNAGIDTFRDDDDNELCQGEDIGPKLTAAIMNSQILIPILSECYGTSSWCLNELVQIMDRKNGNGQMVLPVFYKVKPADVGHQRGSFGEAFHEREKRLLERPSFDPTILEKWKQALNEVSTLKGFEANGYEADLVESIVQKVLSELKKNFELDISENLVGIDRHVEDIMEFVDTKTSHATLFVGIHGMGGIGKTTLAKAIYNKLTNQFTHRSFIADIRESWKRKGAHYLQNQLIYDISNRENEVHNEDEGAKYISSKFKGTKVLLLLDDVDAAVQLKRLAGNRHWFSSGSMIIITTRNERILQEFGVDYAYDHKEMDNHQSLILFSKHAFRRDSPPREFEDLAHEVVSITGGLPLSLEVLGSLLCGQKLAFWGGTIDKLKKVPHEEVQKKLRISYEVLEYEQKQIFLDIACFFIGTDRRMASYMWNACGFFPEKEIEVLRFMSLIKIGDYHELRMHDQLRDLGREIVREENRLEPQNRSRLWDSEEVKKVLKENKGTGNIVAIDLNEGSPKGFGKIVERDDKIYTGEQFKNLTCLRFLHMEKGAHLTGDFKGSMEGLRWLRWLVCPMNFTIEEMKRAHSGDFNVSMEELRRLLREEYPMNFEVKNLHATELVVLDLSSSRINERWQGWSSFVMAKKLKFLDLTNCGYLENTDFLSAFKNLEVLILNSCSRLRQIDSSIGDVKDLVRLELRGCWSLTELPKEIGKLKKLEQLLLDNTRTLSALPESIGALRNLEILNISHSGIEELPNDIGRLRNLRELHAYGCGKLGGKLPESIGSLQNLEILNISHSGIEELPNDIGRLRNLRELHAYGCEKLGGKLAESIGSLQNLEILNIAYTDIEELPHGIGRVRNLRELHAGGCRKLGGKLPESIGSLQNLEILNIFETGIEELPIGIGRLRKLRVLKASYCRNLKGETSESMCNLSSLQGLDFLSCEKLQSLPDLPSSLTYLGVTCQSHKLPSLSHLTRLKELQVSECEFIECIQELPSTLLKNSECSQPTGVEESELPQSLNTPFKLEILIVIGCKSIEILDVSQFIHLRTLSVKSCGNLLEVRGLDKLKYLECLIVEYCKSVERLELPKLEGLKLVNVKYCENLVEIQGLDCLENLSIYQCDSIERLDLPKSRSMKIFHAACCRKLAEIQGIDRLESLEQLSISACAIIERLNLPKSDSLRILDVGYCENLIQIQGLDRLEFLEQLSISWCASIERLNLPKSYSLKYLDVKYCKSLVEIRGLGSLEFLEELNLSRCTSFERLPNLCCFDYLKSLNINGCDKLQDIQSLERFPSCKSLCIEDCKSLAKLPNLSSFHDLRELFLSNCHELQEIQGLEESISLERIAIPGCSSIEILPDLSSCTRLMSLIVQDCEKLTEIRGLEKLEQLAELDISGCKSLKTIPELSGRQLYQNYEKKPFAYHGWITFALDYSDISNESRY